MPFTYIVSEVVLNTRRTQSLNSQMCFCVHKRMQEKEKIMFCELPHFPERRAPTCGLDFH